MSTHPHGGHEKKYVRAGSVDVPGRPSAGILSDERGSKKA